MTTPDIDPFALAVWLHGEARAAYALADAAADPYGAEVTRESAAKLGLRPRSSRRWRISSEKSGLPTTMRAGRDEPESATGGTDWREAKA